MFPKVRLSYCGDDLVTRQLLHTHVACFTTEGLLNGFEDRCTKARVRSGCIVRSNVAGTSFSSYIRLLIVHPVCERARMRWRLGTRPSFVSSKKSAIGTSSPSTRVPLRHSMGRQTHRKKKDCAYSLLPKEISSCSMFWTCKLYCVCGYHSCYQSIHFATNLLLAFGIRGLQHESTIAKTRTRKVQSKLPY